MFVVLLNIYIYIYIYIYILEYKTLRIYDKNQWTDAIKTLSRQPTRFINFTEDTFHCDQKGGVGGGGQ